MSTTMPNLLSPFSHGELQLANRIVMAPLTRARAGVERTANQRMTQYYAQRASAGLVVSEATAISEQAIGWNQTPGIYTDAMAQAWRPIVEAVHARGGKIFLQLWHCGRASHSGFRADRSPPVAPSAVKLPVPETTPVCAEPPPTVPRTPSEEDRFFETERCISAKRTLSMTYWVPPTVIRFETRSPA